MKRFLTIFIIIFLVSCQKSYNAKNEIESLNNMLKEDNTNEVTYIDLFKAYIIDDEYFNAVRTIDKSLKYSEGIQTKELINDLKDGYDIYDINNVFYKRILIDYDINFDPFYEDKRNIDFYQGNCPRIGGNFDSSYYISKYLSSNNQELFKNSNYTIYLLDEEDVISDIYQYTYDVAGKSFYNLKENHYQVKYNDDGTIYYINDDGYIDYFKDGKIIKSGSIDSQNNFNEQLTFEYDKNDFLSKLIETNDNGIIITEFERYVDGSPSKIIRNSDFKENKEFGIDAHTIKEISEYTKDGRMLSRTYYFNDELSFIDTFEFDSNNRLIHEKSTNYNNSAYDYEYVYTYNYDGYIMRKDDLIKPSHYEEYIYYDNYSRVSVCTINDLSRECQKFELYH